MGKPQSICANGGVKKPHRFRLGTLARQLPIRPRPRKLRICGMMEIFLNNPISDCHPKYREKYFLDMWCAFLFGIDLDRYVSYWTLKDSLRQYENYKC